MRAIQQQENGQNAPTIRQSVFLNLMQHCSCDTGDDIETVGFVARNFGYAINFYGLQENGHALTIDEFGHFVNGKWMDCEPTTEQLEIMRTKLSKQVSLNEQLIEEEELEEAYSLQQEADEMRYGHPGAVYGKWY